MEALCNRPFVFNEEAFEAALKQKNVCLSSLPLGCHLIKPPEKAGKTALGLREETVQKTLGAAAGGSGQSYGSPMMQMALPQLSPLNICLILTAVGVFYSSSRVKG